MASLSRGLFQHTLRPLTSPRLLLSELSAASRARAFATTLQSRAAAATSPIKTAAKKAAAPASKKAPLAEAKAPSSYALVKSLATKPTPTVLYEGPSHFWFYFGCWTSGLTILTWTVYSAPMIIFNQPEGVPQFVSWVYGVSYALLASMGFYLISKTPNIVSSIRVLPVAQAAKSAGAAAPKKSQPPAASAVAPPSSVLMEVTVKRMMPFLEPKVLTVPLEKVSLKSRFSLPEEYVPELKRQQRKKAEQEAQKKLRKFDMEHLLTMPFRRLGRAILAMFRGVRSAWTDSGFGVIRVDSKDYKVNVERGFAHDGFRTLERIVPVQTK